MIARVKTCFEDQRESDADGSKECWFEDAQKCEGGVEKI